MPDRTKFEFLGLKAEAEGPVGVKVAAILCAFGLLTVIILALLP